MASIYSSWLSLARTVTFVTTVVFSVIVICVSADLISLTEPAFYYKFSAFALSTGLITVVTVLPMLVVDLLRQGSMLSYIVVEISWLTVLWIFWLSSGSYAAWTDDQIISVFPAESSCSFGIFSVDGVDEGCHEIKAIMAFSFLTWILLMAYTTMLLVLAIRAHGRGRPAWTMGVRDGVLFEPAEKAMGAPMEVLATPATVPLSYPPPAQQPLPSSVPHAYSTSAQAQV